MRGRERQLTELEIRDMIANTLDEDSESEDLGELNGEDDGWYGGEEEAYDDNTQEDDLAEEEYVDNDAGQDDGDLAGDDFELEEGRPTRAKKPRLKDRFVKNLEAALDENSYDPYVQPGEKVVVTGIIEKKKRNVPEKTISWQNQEVARSRAGRSPALQHRKVAPGVVPQYRGADTPLDCFSLFVTGDMLPDVVNHTNARMDMLVESLSPEQLENPNRTKYQYHMQHTDITEIKAFIGIYYLRGLMKENFSDYDILWEEAIGHPIFAATMSKNRFKFLNRLLTFDDRSTRDERLRRDRFAPIREFFEKFNDQCSLVLNIGDYCTIDECLYKCRNRMPFRILTPTSLPSMASI